MNKKYIALLISLTVSTLTTLGQDTLSIVFIGDVMQHTKQLESAHIHGKEINTPESYDYSSYFSRMGSLISGADYAVANMEFPCGYSPYSGYPTFAAPSSLAQEVMRAGVDLFLCANNHIFDKGSIGAEKTIQTYQKMGVEYTGVYMNSKERREKTPYYISIKGIKIAVINFTYGTNVGGGNTLTNYMDSTKVVDYIHKAKADSANIIIAAPHWGVEYSIEASKSQKRWRDILIREGVDAIIGTHPHVIQPIELDYQPNGDIKSVTAYSLGNFISNMSAPNTRLGMVLTLKICKKESSNASIVGCDVTYTWSARAGKFKKKYTTLPIKDYYFKKDEFLSPSEYEKMRETYIRLKNYIQYGK